MRHSIWRASPSVKRRPSHTRGPAPQAAPFRRRPLAAALLLALNGSHAYAAGNAIVTDGRTQTNVQVNGATTNITTSTIKGGNAFNSFSSFSVGQGNTVNLQVPGAAANLVNLVRDQQSVINGVLNAYKNGQIGGNVFFANPNGFVVGATGIVNVGSLSVSTPSRAFLDQLLGAGGVIDTQLVQQLMSGNAPLSTSGVISIQGKVNALDSVSLRGWDVSTGGVISTGPAAAVQVAMFNGSVNAEGLQQGTQLVANNGVIEIVAGNDANIGGKLIADGAAGVNGGRVNVEAGHDIRIAGTAAVSANGAGANSSGGNVRFYANNDTTVGAGARVSAAAGTSGDGGVIEVSATNSVTFSGGSFDTSAQAGKAGRLFVDPTTLVFSAGSSVDQTGDFDMSASDKITIAADGHIRTVNSAGDSGSVTLKAPIIIVDGTIDTSNTVANHKAGDVTLNAMALDSSFPASTVSLTVSGLIDASSTQGHAGKVTLTANAESDGVIGIFSAASTVGVTGTIKGGDVSITSNAYANVSFDSTPASIPATLVDNLMGSAIGINAMVVEAHADSNVNIAGTITSAGDVTILSRIAPKATTPAIVFDLVNPITVATVYGEVLGSATATIASSAHVTTGSTGVPGVTGTHGKLSLTAASDVTLDARAFAFSTDTSQYFAGTGAFGKANITTTSSIASGADIRTGAVDVIADNQNSFSVTATSAANKQGVAGMAIAVSDLTTNTKASIGTNLGVSTDDPTLKLSGNVTVQADSVTTSNVTGTSTDVGTSAINKLLFSAAGGIFDVAKSLLGSSEDKAKGGSSSASGTTPWKVGSSLSINNTTQNVTATIAADGAGPAPIIQTAGDVVVHSNLVDSGVHGYAGSYINSSIKDEDNTTDPAAKKAASFALAFGNFDHESDAIIGNGVQITAARIGIGAESDLPVKITWDDWEGFSSILNKFSARLGLEKEVLTSYANAQGAAVAGGYFGSVNIFQVDNNAVASVGVNASLNATQATDAPWQTQLYTAYSGPTGYTASWSNALTVDARSTVASVNMAGDFSPYGFGTKAGDGATAVGLSFNYINYSNTTNAGIGAGAVVTAAGIGVNAVAGDQALSIAPTSGSGDGKSINGIIALADFDNHTQASISNLARIEAGSVALNAQQEIELWTATGALASSGSIGIGVSIAANTVTTDTEAFIGNNGDWILPGTQVVTGPGYVHADSLAVNAGSDGQINALAVSAADVSSADSQQPQNQPSKLDQLQSKLTSMQQGLSNWLALGSTYLGNATKPAAAAGAGTPGGPQPKYGLSLSASASINIGDMTTAAYIDGVTVKPHTVTVPNDVTVRALNMTDIISASGGAALTRAKAPSTEKSDALAGAVAFSLINNTTDAHIANSTLTDVDDVTVQALSGGFEATVALALAVNKSSQGDKVRDGAGSVSIAQVSNDTTAYVSDSTLTGMAGKSGQDIEVTAYSQALIGTGGGSFYAGGKQSVGLAVTYSKIDNDTNAYVAGSAITGVNSLDVQGLEANTIVGGAAMGGSNTGTGYVGGFVYNDIDQSTSAAIRADSAAVHSTVSTFGNVNVLAKSTKAVTEYESMLDAAVPSSATRDSGISIGTNYGDGSSATDMPFGTGNLIIGAAGMLQFGKENYGLGIVWNQIGNDHTAVIENASVTSTLGTVNVQAKDESTIIGIAAGVSVASGAGSVAGMGTASINLIDNTTEARVGVADQAAVCASLSATCSTSITAAALNVNANNEADIWALAGSVAFSSSKSGGAAVSYNKTTNTSDAHINAAHVDAGTGAVTVNGTSSSKIESASVAIAVGGQVALSGSLDWNVIADDVKAEVTRSAVKANSLSVSADQGEGIDKAAIYSLAGAGLGLNINEIDNSIEAYVTDTALVVPGAVNVSAISAADIWAGAGSLVVGGNESVAIGVASAANTITNSVIAGITNSSLDQSSNVTSVSASDDSNIRSGAVSLAFGSNAGTVAIAYNNIDNKVHAFLHGTGTNVAQADYNARNVVVSAASDADIQTLAVGIAGGTNAGAGSTATNLMGTDVTADIGANAHVKAENNVGVLAHNEDSIAVIAGAAGIGGGPAGVGLSVVVNLDNGDTSAFITGAGTLVDAKGKNAADKLSVDSGVLVNPIDVSSIDPPTATTPDMSEVQATVSGLAVAATSHQAVVTNAVTLGISTGSTGIALVPVVNLMGGTTSAYIDNAAIDTRLGADPTAVGYHAPDIYVGASSHTVVQNLVAAIAFGPDFGGAGAASANRLERTTDAHVTNATIGAPYERDDSQVTTSIVQNSPTSGTPTQGDATVGSPADGSSPPTITNTTTAKSLLPTVGAVTINAKASQGAKDIVIGGAAGAGAGVGTVIVDIFSATTSASLVGGSLHANSLAVTADSKSGFNALTTSAGFGAGGAVAGAFAVGVASDNTSATIGNKTSDTNLSLSGSLTVGANTEDEFNSLLISGAIGGAFGVAAMADVTTVDNATTAGIYRVNATKAAAPTTTTTTDANGNITTVNDGTTDNRFAAAMGNVTVSATEKVSITPETGAGGVGLVGGGVGAGANIVLVKSHVTNEVFSSQLDSTGTVAVTASSDKSIDATTVTFGAGLSGGLGAGVAVIKVGDGDISGSLGELNAGGQGTVYQMDQTNSGLKPASGNTQLSQSQQNQLNAAGTYSVADAINGASSDAVTASVAGGNIHAATVNVNAQGTVSTSSVLGAVGVGGTLGAGGAVGYTRVYDTVTASATQANITASTLNVTANLADGSAGSAVSVDAYAGGAGLVGLGAAVVDTQISNTVTAMTGGSFTGNSTNSATISATDSTSISAKGIGAAVGAAAAGVVIVDAHKRSTVEASLMSGSTLTGYTLSINALNQGEVDAYALGAAGGLLAAGSGAEANASNLSTVRAYTGTNVTLPDGDISITASNSSNQSAEADGVAIGGIIAASGAVANAWSGTGPNGSVPGTPMVTQATLGDGNIMNATRTGKLTVHAIGVDTNTALAQSASGGVLAGNASIARTSDWSTVTAQVGGGSTTNLHAGSADIYAEHTDNYSMTGNSLSASAVGGSGAEASHDGHSTASSVIASNVILTTSGDIDVGARNYFASVNGGPSGLAAGGGGLNGFGVGSSTNLDGTASVLIGDHVSLTAGVNPFTAPADINLVASSVLHHSDEVTLSTGGVIQGAGTSSTLHATLGNNVSIGASDVLVSQGQINAGTFTQAYATATALVSTWGLAAIGSASALADVDTNQSVSVGVGASLTAFDNINLTAGQDPLGVYGTIMIGGASAQGYVRGLIAVPYAYAETKMHNNTSLLVNSGVVVQSGQNVTLGGYRGTLTAAADGTGHGYELGFIPVTIGLDKGETASTSNVTINGTVTAGMYHDLTVDIALNPAANGFTPGITVHDGGYAFTHAYDPAYSIEEFLVGIDPSDAGVLRSGTSSATVGAQKFGQMFAAGGVVNINADSSLGGSGSVTAYGSPKITVNNASRDYLVLAGALIPNQPGGRVNFTGNLASGVSAHEIGRDGAGIISINNTYNVASNGNLGNSSYGPAMLLTGPVMNLGGLIKLGSVSGSLGQTGQILGQTVNVDFPAGVAVISSSGTYTAGGNPISDWGPYMIWPGGNPANGAPDANDAIAYVANAEHYADRFNADGTLRTDWQFTQALIGVEGTMPGQGPHGNNSFVYYGYCATAAFGDCSGGTAAAMSPVNQTFSQHGDWNYAVVPVLSLTKGITAYPQSVLNSAAASSSIYGSQVAINARYIDINATISAGQPTNWSVNLPASLTSQLAYDNFLYRIGAGSIFNVVGTANAGDSLIGVKYNAQTQQLIVDDVNASSGGGSVKLSGGIISTNPLGKIHVNGGLGQVTIDNQTAVPLVVQKINAGDTSLASALTSQVEIIDTLQKIQGGTNPDHWWYVYNPTQGVSVYNNANGATTLKDGNGVIIANQVPTNGPVQYKPRQDLRWQWEEYATMERPTWHRDANGNWVVDGTGGWKWTSGTSNNPWLFVTSTGGYSTEAQGDNVFIKPNDPNVFEQSITGQSTGWFTWDIYHVGCGGYIGSSCHYNFAQTTSNPDESHWYYQYLTSAQLKLTQSVKADNAVGIDFSGNALGKIAVSSNAPVSLTGALVNPNGNTSLAATTATTPLSNAIPIVASIWGIPFLTSPNWNQALIADAAGSSITETGTASIRTSGLTISAAAGIGTADSPLRATLSPGGVLQANGGGNGVYLNLNSGANVKSVSSGNGTSGYGDVSIVAAGDLMPTGGGTNVSGRSITIDTTQGSIGSSAAPMVISAHPQQVGNVTGGIVNVSAPGNIGLKQVGGDLLVGAITSGGGYINVSVPDGSILDASGLTSGQALSPEQVAKVWQDLHLTSANGAEANAIATSVKPLEDRVNLHYGQYLTLLAHGTVSNGAFVLGSAPADTALVAAAATAAGQTPQAYAAALYRSLTDSFVADIGANWNTLLGIAAKDPSFKYTATADQIIALTGNAVWSESQLTIAIRKAALDPDPGPRPVGTGVPNIVAQSGGANGVGNVTLSAGGSIGNLAASAVITADNLASGVLDATQTRALALAASPGDVTLTWQDAQHHVVTLDNSGAQPVWKDYLGNVLVVNDRTQVPDGVQLTNVQIRQTAPLFVNAPGVLDVTAGQGVYLQSGQQLKIEHLQAGGTVNLATTAGITAATSSSASPQIVTSGDLALNAEQADIGTDAAHPLSVQIGGKLVLATAGGNVWLSDTSGDLVVGNVFAGQSLALEALAGSILADPTQSGLTLRAHDIDIHASQDIGSTAKPLQIATASDGELNGSAGGGAWISAPASSTSGTVGSLRIGEFTTGGDFQAATARDLTLGPVSAGGAVSLLAGRELAIDAGTRITSGAALNAQGATITMGAGSAMNAQDAVTLTTTTGDMVLGNVTSLLASGDAFTLNSAGNVRGNGDGQVNLVANQAGAHAIINAQTGIGASTLPLELDLPWLQAATTLGGITIHNRSNLFLKAVSTTSGDVSVATDGALQFETVSASGNVTLAASAGALTGNSITSGGDISATARDALDIQFVTSAGSSSLVSGADMTLDTVTAGNAISLDFGGGLKVKKLNAASASISGAHDIVIDDISVKTALNLAAPNIQVGVTQTVASPALNMNVTGYRGSIAHSIGLKVNAPAGVTFGKLWGEQVTVSTTGDYVGIASGKVPGWLSLKTASTNLLMDNQDQTLRPVNIQLYEPDFEFSLTQTGRSAFTSAYVLRFDTGYMAGVPNFTEKHTLAPIDVFGISVIDDATRNGQFRPPLAPLFTPPAQPGPWAVPWTYPVELPKEGGAVNTSEAEGAVIEVARQ